MCVYVSFLFQILSPLYVTVNYFSINSFPTIGYSIRLTKYVLDYMKCTPVCGKFGSRKYIYFRTIIKEYLNNIQHIDISSFLCANCEINSKIFRLFAALTYPTAGGLSSS